MRPPSAGVHARGAEPEGASPAGRLAWQCRRGTRELDELLLSYLNDQFPHAEVAERLAFERLLGYQDAELIGFLLGGVTPQDPEIRHVIQRLSRLVA